MEAKLDPSSHEAPKPDRTPLDVSATLNGRSLLVVGATGFLGKVWLAMLLHRYPEIGRLYVMVRSKKGLDAESRFWSEIAPSPVFDPIREQKPGASFDRFLQEKITVVDGDVGWAKLGLSDALLNEMRAARTAIVNVAGVVDFNPPLDEALSVNAFGAQNLLAVARALGDAPILHTSTCFVVGRRDGLILEHNPLDLPFPRADELDRSHWNAENEIAECVDLIEHTKRRVEDAPRQSHLLDEARRNLRERGEPLRGPALADELEKVKRRFVRQRLVDAGRERAQFWGWPNIYTYTKSIGEQVLIESGLPVTIVRPAIVESAMDFPKVGWCEGIQTSTPIMYLAMQGLQHVPVGDHCYYDLIPVDMCAAAMIAATAALLAGTHELVYQMSSADLNPLRTKRAGELIALSKRHRYKHQKTDGNKLVNFVQAHTEPKMVSLDTYNWRSAPMMKSITGTALQLFKQARGTPFAPLTEPLRSPLEKMNRTSRNVAMIVGEFIPFITQFEYRFSAKNTRTMMANLTEDDRGRLPWGPEHIDWRHYWLTIHTHGFNVWAEPLLEEKLERKIEPLRRHANLVDMLEDCAERNGHAMAFQRLEGEELTRVSYEDVLARARAVAARLHAAGIGKGDRVLLGARNHPDWPIAYFGICTAGAVVVPLDATWEASAIAAIARASGAKAAFFDEKTKVPSDFSIPIHDVHEVTRRDDSLVPPKVLVDDDDLASIIYTSGTTGDPKGVMLTHENFTALVAALAPLFPLRRNDRLLSVLPLHHTFEFTCGMLLPFSRGARVVYLDEVVGDRVVKGLKLGRATAMVGVPALWQLLERKILQQVRDRGRISESLYKWTASVNRTAGRKLGLDLGKMLFGPVHDGLGGHLRTLISGGSALPKDVFDTFAGLGLHLSEGYGLTEAAPVLAVSRGGPSNRPGHVGKPIPGVEIRIDGADDNGIGEVVARGPNVMKGYFGNEDATAEVLADGWLRTGDLGYLDKKGQLHIVGRSKEVIVPASGENVYPDDVENLLGTPRHIKELSVVGVPDGTSNERVAVLAVPERPSSDEALAPGELHRRARESLREAIDALPRAMRPTIVHLTDVDLPRTATRKVKRKDVVRFIERLEKAETAMRERAVTGTASEIVRSAIAILAKRDEKDIRLDHDLAADLGFDSLMMVELATALDTHLPPGAHEKIGDCKTVADVEALVQKPAATEIEPRKAKDGEDDEDDKIVVPEIVRKAAIPVLTETQRRFFEQVMDVRLAGEGNIPHNRNTIVVANHASHLDMGLVKYALGSYGHELVALAAEDYFFKDKWVRAFFENFTDIAPLDRKSGLRKALTQAGEHLARGKTVLIFPEGTRSPDGRMRDFMPLIGSLSLNHNVDILPLWLGGTHRALPKGSRLPIPRRRKLEARIGPALRVDQLLRKTSGFKRADAYREVAKIAQRAVEHLRDGKVLDLDHEDAPARAKLVASTVEPIIDELRGKFVKGAVAKTVSFYFSIGDGDDGKWSLVIDAEKAVFVQGRPASGTADCVLKTTEDIFSKIVREHYTPSVAEFMSGKVKSNDISLLQVFQKAFAL